MQALPRENLRQLARLLQGMTAVRTDTRDAATLSPPHERALASALGLASHETPDGLLPWAAKDAAELLNAGNDKAWAWVTPCHWAMGHLHATLIDPAALALREDESRALLAIMQPYFETDGITLHFLTPERWLAEGELFRHLPTASLDRVLARNVDAWLPGDRRQAERSAGPPQASSAPEGLEPAAPNLLEQVRTGDRGEASREPRPARPRALHEVKSVGVKTLTRLQNEMQMLLYTHPFNDAREANRQLPVNSFWLSGTGALPANYLPRMLEISTPRELAQAVFKEDWAAYGEVWGRLDAGEIAVLLNRQRAGETVHLTLCGEHSAQTFESRKNGFFTKISSFFAPTSILNVLQKL